MSVGASGNHSSSPTIIINELVYQKIMHWVNKSSYEVSGLGKLVVEPSGAIRVVSAFLLPQRNTSVTTDIEAGDVAKAMYEMANEPGDIRFWWHSHVNMGVFWSGTDLDTIRVLSQGGWFVSTVFNKRSETKTCISMNDPFPLMYDNVPLTIERLLPAELVAQWNKEYEDKVTNIVPKPTPMAEMGRRLFPYRPSAVQDAPWTKEQQKQISRLADIMNQNSETNSNFPGLGSDGVYHDLDDDNPYRSSLHNDNTVQDVLRRRDIIEDRIEKYEERQSLLFTQEKDIPEGLTRALDLAQVELDEVEDELDVLVANSMLSEEERYAHPRYEIQNQITGRN